MELTHTFPSYLRFCATMNKVQKETMTTLTFSAETLELIENLEENNYYYDDMVEFINQHGETDFVKFYEDYVELGENHSYDAVDAYVEAFGLDYLSNFEESFEGVFNSEGDFAREYVEMIGDSIPDYVVVDWEATWNYNLRYDFVYQDGYVFRNC